VDGDSLGVKMKKGGGFMHPRVLASEGGSEALDPLSSLSSTPEASTPAASAADLRAAAARAMASRIL
jgi:hypothetical protein